MYNACVKAQVQPLNARIESAKAKIELLDESYRKAVTSSNVPVSKIPVSQKALDNARAELSSLQKQKETAEAKCNAIRNQANIQIPKDNYMPKSERLTALYAQDKLNKRALSLWEAKDFRSLKTLGELNPQAVRYALGVAYARLTNGGTFCRVNTTAIDKLYAQVKGTGLDNILYDALVVQRYPVHVRNYDRSPLVEYTLDETGIVLWQRLFCLAYIQQRFIAAGWTPEKRFFLPYFSWQDKVSLVARDSGYYCQHDREAGDNPAKLHAILKHLDDKHRVTIGSAILDEFFYTYLTYESTVLNNERWFKILEPTAKRKELWANAYATCMQRYRQMSVKGDDIHPSIKEIEFRQKRERYRYCQNLRKNGMKYGWHQNNKQWDNLEHPGDYNMTSWKVKISEDLGLPDSWSW